MTAPTPRDVLADALMTAHFRHTEDCQGPPTICTCHFYEDLATVRAALTGREPLDVERLTRVLRYIHGDNVPFPTGRTPEEYAAFIVQCDARLEAER